MPELLKPIKPLARSTNTYKFQSKCWCEFILEKYFACKWLFQITNQFELLILFNFFPIFSFKHIYLPPLAIRLGLWLSPFYTGWSFTCICKWEITTQYLFIKMCLKLINPLLKLLKTYFLITWNFRYEICWKVRALNTHFVIQSK